MLRLKRTITNFAPRRRSRPSWVFFPIQNRSGECSVPNDRMQAEFIYRNFQGAWGDQTRVWHRSHIVNYCRKHAQDMQKNRLVLGSTSLPLWYLPPPFWVILPMTAVTSQTGCFASQVGIVFRDFFTDKQ